MFRSLAIVSLFPSLQQKELDFQTVIRSFLIQILFFSVYFTSHSINNNNNTESKIPPFLSLDFFPFFEYKFSRDSITLLTVPNTHSWIGGNVETNDFELHKARPILTKCNSNGQNRWSKRIPIDRNWGNRVKNRGEGRKKEREVEE